jgi:prephenate dehydrogenase
VGVKRTLVGIIGGTGRMGSWLAHLLTRQGMCVISAGRRTELTPEQVAKQCQVIVISVPIAETTDMIRRIGPMVHEDGLLMDLTSLKKAPLESMLTFCRAGVVGTHPLFGPEDVHQNNRTVVLCPGRGEQWQTWIRDVFHKSGLKTLIMDPCEHDRVMALVQGVSHLSALALAVAMQESGMARDEILACSTLSFHSSQDRITRLLKDSSELLADIQMQNPQAAKMREGFIKAVHELARLIDNGDRSGFSDLCASLRSYYDIR